jgi:hypothetical protein
VSVILEALQKAHTTDGKRTSAESRVVDVRPANGVKIRPASPLRIVWLCISFLLLLVVGAAGAGAFYWVLEHRSQFTFGFSPVAVAPTVAPPAQAQADTPGPKQIVSSSATIPETAKSADLPPPVPIQAVAQPTAVSTQALPPPPVGAPAAVGAATQSAAAGNVSPTPASLFALGTILFGDGNDCAAIVNGKTVHRGDMIKEHRVVDITSTEVRLQRNTEPPVVLSLFR